MPVVCRVDAKLLDWTSIIHFKFHVKNKTRFRVYNLHRSSAFKKFSQF